MNTADKKLLIGGIRISEDFRVMPGAGIAKNFNDIKRLCENEDIKIVILGSITFFARPGNPGNVFHADRFYTVNSIGMANEGHGKYKMTLKQIINYVHSKGKKIVISIASVDDIKDYLPLIKLCKEVEADGIEINYGCPNVMDNGKPHSITSFDPPLMKASLNLIQERFGLFLPPIWVKLSPLVLAPKAVRVVNPDQDYLDVKMDVELINKVAKVLNEFEFIKAVVCTNTIGNVRVQDENGKPVLGPNPNNKDLTGGLASSIIHEHSVSQARLMKYLLNPKIDIIGAGGVKSGRTMDDFMKVGCCAVQVVSEYFINNEEPSIFSQIGAEYYGD